METLLDIRNLKTHIQTRRGTVRAVDGVSLTVGRGETVGIVGESGCGKSMMALSVMRLLPKSGRIIDGEVIFNGADLTKLSESEMRQIRGKEISMIFQEPMTALNPLMTVGDQIAESVRLHLGTSRKESQRRAAEILSQVGIPDSDLRIRDYPHQMSGGMRQRVMIGMAIACHPSLLIADEPTTALDVTIQAQILDLIAGLREEIGMSVLLISHDFGVVAGFADKIAVFYAGQVVETASSIELFDNPLHPYTIGLLKSMPDASRNVGKLQTIEGTPPDPISEIRGCRFADRCSMAEDICREHEPELIEHKSGHLVRCSVVTGRF